MPRRGWTAGIAKFASIIMCSLLLKQTIVYDESGENSEADPNESAPERFEQQVDVMLSLLGLRYDSSYIRNGSPPTHSLQSLTFSNLNMTMEALTKLKITFTGFVALKPDSEKCGEHVPGKVFREPISPITCVGDSHP